MVAALSDWSPAAVFAAALLSPGWGALLAGGFPWVFASSPELLGICAAAGGFLRDAGIYAILRRQNAETEKMPAGGFSLFSCIALQSIHLFRLDLARRAAADCVPSLRFFGALAAGSCLGALVGAFIAYFGLAAYFGGWGRESAYPILTGLIVLALLVAETWRIVLERLILRYRLHENSPR